VVERNLAAATNPTVARLEPAELSKSAVRAIETSRPTIAQLITLVEPQALTIATFWISAPSRTRIGRVGLAALAVLRLVE
jgi:hypothetical protein